LTTVTRLSTAAISRSMEGVIAGAIVNQNDFKSFAGGFHHRFEAVVEVGDVFLLVVERDNDGVLGHRFLL
jgi:hypothetical protein